MRDYMLGIGRDGPKRAIAELSNEDIAYAIDCISRGRFERDGSDVSAEDMLERLRIELVARSLA